MLSSKFQRGSPKANSEFSQWMRLLLLFLMLLMMMMMAANSSPSVWRQRRPRRLLLQSASSNQKPELDTGFQLVALFTSNSTPTPAPASASATLTYCTEVLLQMATFTVQQDELDEGEKVLAFCGRRSEPASDFLVASRNKQQLS